MAADGPVTGPAPDPGAPGLVRVLVCDDHPIARTAYRAILSAAGFEVVGEAEDGVVAVELARRCGPDVLLLDLDMPRMDGIEVTRVLARSAATSGVRVVVVTTYDSDRHVLGALQAGACGFLLKDAQPAEIVTAVRAAAAGDVLLDRAALDRLLTATSRVLVPGLADLTARERDVLVAAAQGLSNPEIARRSHTGVETVKTQMSRVLRKLRVRGRVEAVIAAHRAGIVPPPD